MAEVGGYQQPRNPASVSGPGRLSRRTDGGPQQTTNRMSGMAYGENQDYNDIQSLAPLRATSAVDQSAARRPRRGGRAGGGPITTPLMSPTRRPNEPVTAGASFGPGRTVSESERQMQMRSSRRPTVVDTLSKIAPYDTSGRLGSIVNYLRSM